MTDDGAKRKMDQRLGGLTPAQRELLVQRLMERRMDAARRNAISPREDDAPAPLSYAQESLWLLSEVLGDGVAYNVPSSFQLTGALDLELLQRALEALVERHSILRTTYRLMDGTPMQFIGAVEPVAINLIDLRGRHTDEQHAESQRILKEEARFRFDLVNGPLVRPTVIRVANEEHILMLNMSHIVTDGYSRNVLYGDLTVLYEAFAKGLPSPLAPPRIQYTDYAVWQRAWLDQGVVDSQLDYWRRKLAGAPSRLELPTDLPRPPVRSWVGDVASLMLDTPTREALRRVGRRGDATLFVALLAVFGTLLARYSGQDDIVIGTPFGARGRTELESIVGYFINPLALRLDLSGDPTVTELIARARETTLEAFAHADVRYESVVRVTNPQRDLSQTPVFQAMMVFHNPAWRTHQPKFEPDGIRCVEISHEKGVSKFDVLLAITERNSGLNTSWEYSTELFTRATVERMMQHFRALVVSAGRSADRRISRLSMLSEAERSRVLVAWNAKPKPLPQRATIKELFEEQVARTGQAPAIVFDGERLTFDELNGRANRVAWLLREMGVGPGDLVGILMEKSLDLVPAVLGVLKSGAAYIPLDPLYPTDRIEFILSDAQPRLLLTQERHLGMPLGDVAQRLAVDAPAALERFPHENPPSFAEGDDIAYVIYTSGSTGQPKGAMIANKSLASAYFAYERAHRLRELTAHAQMASFAFDVFTGDMIRALLAGAKLVLCAIETVADPAALYQLILEEGIDAAEFVPATATLLFEYVESQGKRLENMQLVIVGSEAWKSDKYRSFMRVCGPHTRLVNAYGVTEATIDSTWFEPETMADLPRSGFVPIGRPLDNTRIYILDANLEPQPIGISGELCIGGVAVAQGYLNRPELTAEKFVPDRFCDQPGALLYRTGDRARWLPDGNIDFLGRTDRQIKIRGFRIEPGEIEAVLERRPAIRAAAVVDRLDSRGETRLIAYIDTNGPAPKAAELRAFLSDHVPNYMIPSTFLDVDELPLTPNGKVDRDALPEPEWDQERGSEFLAPRTDTERAIAEIWSNVLSVSEIGIQDNFFALGGHSLLAMKVISRLHDELGVTLTLRAIFEVPNVMELAAKVDRAEASAVAEPPPLVRLARS